MFYSVDEYIQGGFSHLIVDPDKDLMYTKRKQRLIGGQGKDTEVNADDNETSSLPLRIKFPEGGWKTSLEKSPTFTSVEMKEHISKSAKRHPESTQSLPTGLQKAKAYLQDEYLHDIQTNCDQRYFYYRAKCFHSFKTHEQAHQLKLVLCIVSGDVKYANCGPTCAAGLSGFCNHILALMMKICKYNLYSCTDVRDLKDEEDENPKAACTSSLQTWHRSRLDGVRAQPVMEIVVSNPSDNVEREQKKGVVCLLTEARRRHNMDDAIKRLKNLQQSLGQHDSKLGLEQAIDINNINNLPLVDTRFGQCPVGSFGSYQLTITESDFTVITSLTENQVKSKEIPSLFPCYPSLPVDDLNGSFYIPENISNDQKQLLQSLQINVIEANKLESQTRQQASSDKWMKERKYRLTASNFGRIKSRQRNHTKFVEDLLEQKQFSTAATQHGKDHESTALQKYETHLRRMQKPVKVLESGLFVSPKIPILGCTPDAKVIDLSVTDCYGICEVKCPYSKMNVTPFEASKDPAFLMEIVDDKPRLKRRHVYYDQVQGQMGITGVHWCDFICYTKKGLSIERIMFDENHWDTLCDKLCFFLF